MDSIAYQTVFDIGHQGPQYWWLLGIPLVMVTVGIAMLRSGADPKRRTFMVVWTSFAGLVGIVLAASIATEYSSMRSALAHGRYRVVEGVVSDFVPASAGDHHPEQFAVVTPAGRFEYSYSWSVVTQGFNESTTHDGPMRDGLRVRIADVNGKIARLEIAR